MKEKKDKLKLRRSMLFVQGTRASLLSDAFHYSPDAVIFDLEDSVSVYEKDNGRHLVKGILSTKIYKEHDIETVVRINDIHTMGKEDLEIVMQGAPDVIRLPKTSSPDDLLLVEEKIEELEKKYGLEVGSTNMMAAIEDVHGLINVNAIAKCTKRLVGIALGGEDFVTNLKTQRTTHGTELLFARSQILLAARAVGIQAFDSVYSDIENKEEFIKEATLIKEIGFDGKSLIHPTQIKLLHDIYAPTQKEIAHALKILKGIEGQNGSSGVFVVDGKMVDNPMFERAKYTIEKAEASGILCKI